MELSSVARRALAIGLVAAALAAVPTAAFEPSVTVSTGNPSEVLRVTDMAGRGDDLAVTIDRSGGGQRAVSLRWSADGGTTWDGDGFGDATRESQTTVCDGQAFMAYAKQVGAGWNIETFHWDVDGPSGGGRQLTASGLSRKPDITCVKDTEAVVAWFQKHGSSYHVHLATDHPGEDPAPQSFDLGTGSVSRGMAIASSSSRVYVAWFDGSALKLRRFSIGSAPNYSLHGLGTTTIATLKYGSTPKIGADGSSVILAYTDRADLKVRRSTDRGTSFGGAKTLLDEPFPSEIGAAPTTVAIKGSKIAIGVLETSESTGSGIGFLSTNGGSSYVQQAIHAGGQTVAALDKVGSSYRYADAWDEQFGQLSTERVRFRRQ